MKLYAKKTVHCFRVKTLGDEGTDKFKGNFQITSNKTSS